MLALAAGLIGVAVAVFGRASVHESVES